MTSALDPHDPQVWFRLLVDAVAGLLVNNVEPAKVYGRFVEQHRGREVAVKAWQNAKALARDPSWRHAAFWQANGYATKDPKKEKVKWR